MKWSLAIAFTLVASVFRLYSQGYIVPNGIGASSGVGMFNLGVIQNPSNGDYTGFVLESQNATAFLFSPALDEGVRTFMVSPNDPISWQPILANSYPELTFANSYTFENGVPFYLGLYTGYNPYTSGGTCTGIYTDPLFGWARLININGTIQLLGSALGYGGGGIYAGTQTIIPIPEPSVLGLAGLSAVLIAFRRYRNS